VLLPGKTGCAVEGKGEREQGEHDRRVRTDRLDQARAFGVGAEDRIRPVQLRRESP
jgi:hypothetical protein